MKKKKVLFSEETIQSLIELGEVLHDIHNRLISDGYVIKDGRITPTKSEKKHHEEWWY